MPLPLFIKGKKKKAGEAMGADAKGAKPKKGKKPGFLDKIKGLKPKKK